MINQLNVKNNIYVPIADQELLQKVSQLYKNNKEMVKHIKTNVGKRISLYLEAKRSPIYLRLELCERYVLYYEKSKNNFTNDKNETIGD